MKINYTSNLEAVVVVPAIEASQPVHPYEFKILGLTVIERTLRALEKNSVEHVTFLLENGIEQLQSLLAGLGNWSMSFSFLEKKKWRKVLKSYHLMPPTKGLLWFFEPLVFDPQLIEKLMTKGQQMPTKTMLTKNGMLAFISADRLKEKTPEYLISSKDTLSSPAYLRPTRQPFLCSVARDMADVEAIEKSLIRNLVKPNDGWVSRHLNRPVSTRFSRLLAPTRITPNQVTLMLVLPSLFTGYVLSQGGYWCFLLGGALFHLTSILDGVDGELARLKFKSSLYGKWLDFMCDNLAYLAALVGFFIGLFRDGISSFEKVASLTALFLTLCMMTSIILYYQRFNKDGKLLTVEYGFRDRNGWLDRLMQYAELLGKREWFALIFFALAIFGQLQWALVYVCLVAAGVLLFSFEAHAMAKKKASVR